MIELPTTNEPSGRADLPQDVTGIVLAGGQSTRLGQDKALLEIQGRTLVERVIDRLRCVVARIVLVTNSPDRFAFLALPTARDRIPGVGTLGGLHAGLGAIDTEYGLVVGCDMPFLSVALLRHIISLRGSHDVVMPCLGKHYEPLHALYARCCLPSFERSILLGERRIMQACAGMFIQYVEEEQITRLDPECLSFFNVNTPEDLERANQVLART
jgi:molybdopterin-guanine dinucleotide biosynthesis protein A